MADYWKSQPRHFCEFCKCWTADNKPSRDFHERGKRHQDNVKKKLDELRRKGFEDAKKEKEMSSYLQEMEKAALSKLKEDLVADPTLASQYGVVLKNKRKVNADSETTSSCQQASGTVTESSCSVTDNDVKQSVGEWIEATTPEGYVYYWNSVTMESRWELPSDAEQTDGQGVQTSTEVTIEPAIIDTHKQTDEDQPVTKKKKKKIKDETLTMKETDKDETSTLKETAKSDGNDAEIESKSTPSTADLPSTTCTASSRQPAPAVSRHSAYGAWEEVKEEVEEPVIDLQLPQDTKQIVEQKTLVIPSEPKIKFREKKVADQLSGSSGGFVGFRKPKSAIQRSIRTTDLSEET